MAWRLYDWSFSPVFPHRGFFLFVFFNIKDKVDSINFVT